MALQRSLAWPLAAVSACLVVYASLHPFGGWRWPPHLDTLWLRVPQPTGMSRFDIQSNLLGYLPLGALLAVGLLRSGCRRWQALLFALLAAGALSYALETLQHLLPRRVSSLHDWGLNAAGAALGALLVLLVDGLGGFALWQGLRERWLLRGRGVGLTLLLLWPFGLLFPPPLPFGLGQVLGRSRDALAGWLEGSAWDGWLRAEPLRDAPPLPLGIELLAVASGLLAPCLLAYALTRPGLHRLVLLAGALLLGTLAATLSTALNFGPEHAFAWVTAPVGPAVWLTALLAALAAWVPARTAAALALPVLGLLIALVHLAPSDPFYAASLQAWEQGRFIRFHGLSQWIGWLWPYATLIYLLGGLARRRE